MCPGQALLLQEGHQISHFSKRFCPKLQHSSTYIHELHASTFSIQKWRNYLLGRKSTIEADDKISLTELMLQFIQIPDQHYYLTKLLGYDYSIFNSSSDSYVMILSIPILNFLNQLKLETATFLDLQDLYQQIQSKPEAHPF